MNFPSPAADYAEQTPSKTSICNYDGNCRTIDTSAGYAIFNIARKAKIGDTVLISFCGKLDFASVQGKALITPDGEAIEGDAFDDVVVLGVVTYLLSSVTDTDDRPVI
ncbi:hypothetical protein [Enterobacter cloacae]|uniref:hypothetical protein n=1 Tax=Enterobacter cloacae TaxID=550 RepID=UPI00218442C0|nr:hypothetical protein [Enterobacter cloacae]MCT2766609.1 hypothetical protein [Enterobacter cloacae]